MSSSVDGERFETMSCQLPSTALTHLDYITNPPLPFGENSMKRLHYLLPGILLLLSLSGCKSDADLDDQISKKDYQERVSADDDTPGEDDQD
jgi:hypothetical protein